MNDRAPGAGQEPERPEARPRLPRRRRLATAAVVLAILAVAGGSTWWWFCGRGVDGYALPDSPDPDRRP
ncbi:hypothetical protein CU254_16590 [Amycolatopsis sp. AA4]|uniref:hypothetical protein n=1 Tax=Actinomycetes TaxID=1760 RepID=UPI0001B585CA|nr:MULTISPECIES: hypothetical protein [Actinomycetes]ATY11900.1 hypothetical protein CU254_16590 [Amycolatopsis sp. AA4]